MTALRNPNIWGLPIVALFLFFLCCVCIEFVRDWLEMVSCLWRVLIRYMLYYASFVITKLIILDFCMSAYAHVWCLYMSMGMDFVDVYFVMLTRNRNEELQYFSKLNFACLLWGTVTKIVAAPLPSSTGNHPCVSPPFGGTCDLQPSESSETNAFPGAGHLWVGGWEGS